MIAILKRLALEGLLEKNKALTLADVPIRVGLITGEGTAAYKDFTTKLAESPFNFKVKTAYAKMQAFDSPFSVDYGFITADESKPKAQNFCTECGAEMINGYKFRHA